MDHCAHFVYGLLYGAQGFLNMKQLVGRSYKLQMSYNNQCGTGDADGGGDCDVVEQGSYIK